MLETIIIAARDSRATLLQDAAGAAALSMLLLGALYLPALA